MFRRNPAPLFDGGLLRGRLHSFLGRVNAALSGVSAALPDHEIEGVEVSLTIDAALNVGFAGPAANLDTARTFTFHLKPRCNRSPKPS